MRETFFSRSAPEGKSGLDRQTEPTPPGSHFDWGKKCTLRTDEEGP